MKKLCKIIENISVLMKKEAQLFRNNVLEISQKPYISYIFLIY
jgi:hypothetical protein